jgi:hypothetical protein
LIALGWEPKAVPASSFFEAGPGATHLYGEDGGSLAEIVVR